MDTRQVRYFLAVVEHGGFGRAAAALGVAQPTLSQSVKALERDLGAVLFHRASHGVVLCAAGRAFLGPARQLIRDVAIVGESVGGGRDRPTLEIVVAAPLATHPGAALVGSYIAAQPDVMVHLDRVPEGGSDGSNMEDALLAQVRDGVSELGLGYLPVSRSDLCELELGRHRLVLAFPPGTELPDRPVSLTALDDRSLVASPRGSSQRGLVESALRTTGARPRLVAESGQGDLVLTLVLAGAGAAFLPDAAAAGAAEAGAVVRAVEPPLCLAYGLVHRPVELSRAAAAFVTHVGV